jgi:hypothetical protein
MWVGGMSRMIFCVGLGRCFDENFTGNRGPTTGMGWGSFQVGGEFVHVFNADTRDGDGGREVRGVRGLGLGDDDLLLGGVEEIADGAAEGKVGVFEVVTNGRPFGGGTGVNPLDFNEGGKGP